MTFFRFLALALVFGLIAVIARGCDCEANGGTYVRSGSAYRCVIEP